MERTKHNLKGKEPPDQQGVTLPTKLLNVLYRVFGKESGDMIQLYLFYRHTLAWQKKNPIHATDSYCWNDQALCWTNTKFYKIKPLLKEIGLIRIVQRRKTGKAVKGLFNGQYIMVNYMYDENMLKAAINRRRIDDKTKSTNYTSNKSNIKTPQFSVEQAGNTAKDRRSIKKPDSDKQETNTLRNKVFKYSPSGTHLLGGVPSDKKKNRVVEDEEDNNNLPLEEKDEYGNPINNKKELKRTKKPIKHLPKKIKDKSKTDLPLTLNQRKELSEQIGKKLHKLPYKIRDGLNQLLDRDGKYYNMDGDLWLD